MYNCSGMTEQSTDLQVENAELTRRIFSPKSEMGRFCAEIDWASTALGPVASWPQSLRTAVGMVVEQGIAQSLCWGPDLIQIYNDGYRIIMGNKHPDGLGRPLFRNWAEISGQLRPLVDRVLEGETLYFEDLEFQVDRSGSLEPAFFTFSYSPVRLESGEVGGMLINCFETTDQVQARAVQAERDRLLDSIQFERSRLQYVFEQAPTFLAVLRGPEHTFELANQAYYNLIGNREVVGLPVRQALPEIVEQGFVAMLDQVLSSGEPILGSEAPVQLSRTPGAPIEERFADFAFLPLIEADGQRTGVIAHGYDVTEQVLARQEIERLLAESEEARTDLEDAFRELELRQAEVQQANQRLQEIRSELEMQAEELQLTATALEEGTESAQQARAEAERAEQHLARVIEQAPVAMYIALGREHVFDVVNTTYLNMVGRTAEEVIGRPGREVFPEFEEQGVFDLIDGVFDSGIPYRSAAIPAVFDTDGDGLPEKHYFNLVYQPLFDSRDQVYAIALVATEVTDLVQAREAAEHAQREAELANQAKSDFLASMSHELRTPLNAIGGYVELVSMGIHGPVTEEQRTALDRVRASQQHLLTLINDVLAFAKIEAGRIELDLRPHEARHIVASVGPLVAPLATAKGINLVAHECEESIRLMGDEERVRQILLNLVGNAIKFTPSGGTVRLQCHAAGGSVELAVEDNGPGIPLEKQQAIFDPFIQVERRFSNPSEGVGLGLAISRDLALAMGGDLSVVSEPNKGSVFTLHLPAA